MRRTAIFAAMLFLWGASALVLETTWLRWFRLAFGATAPATAATLVAFFGGQSLGAALAASRLRSPARAFAWLAGGAAIFAALVPFGLEAGGEAIAGVYDDLSGSPGLLAGVRFAVALAVTLPTTLCLGAALPALLAAGAGSAARLGTTGARLYAVELLGAAAGAAAAAFWLPEKIGVRATYALAVAALAALAVAATRTRDATAASQPASDARVAGPGTGWIALAALSGFGAFAAQVLLVQAFAQVVNQSVQAFGAILVVLLASLAAGAAAASVLARRSGFEPRVLLTCALAAAGIALCAFPAALAAYTDGLDYLGSDRPGFAYVVAVIVAAAVTAGPALVPAALVLPLVFGAARGTDDARAGAAGARLGRLLAANAAGAVVGAVAAPFFMLPVFGLWPSFLALALVYAAPAIFVAPPRRRLASGAGVGIGFAAVVAFANPLERPVIRESPGARVVESRVTSRGVVAVLERAGELLIQIDNHYALGGTGESVHEERQGHLPLLLHPDPRRVAFVGTATGITAGAALAHPVESIDLVEIVPGVVDAARRHFHDANRGVHEDPRARIVLDDARNFFASTGREFDVVVADLFVPWRADAGSLYAREHFENVRARLAPGGLFCQWLALYQLGGGEFRTIAATFLDTFPRAAVFRGDFYGAYPIAALCGWRDAPAPAADVSTAVARLAASGARDRWVTDPLGVWSLYVGPLSPLSAALAAAPRNEDDRPVVQFRAGRGHAGGDRGRVDPFVGARWVAFQEELLSASAGAGDGIYPTLSEAARSASVGGALLQTAGALWAAGHREPSARALEAAAARLPDRLLRDAPADPTAAEVWPAE